MSYPSHCVHNDNNLMKSIKIYLAMHLAIHMIDLLLRIVLYIYILFSHKRRVWQAALQ